MFGRLGDEILIATILAVCSAWAPLTLAKRLPRSSTQLDASRRDANGHARRRPAAGIADHRLNVPALGARNPGADTLIDRNRGPQASGVRVSGGGT